MLGQSAANKYAKRRSWRQQKTFSSFYVLNLWRSEGGRAEVERVRERDSRQRRGGGIKQRGQLTVSSQNAVAKWLSDQKQDESYVTYATAKLYSAIFGLKSGWRKLTKKNKVLRDVVNQSLPFFSLIVCLYFTKFFSLHRSRCNKCVFWLFVSSALKPDIYAKFASGKGNGERPERK